MPTVDSWLVLWLCCMVEGIVMLLIVVTVVAVVHGWCGECLQLCRLAEVTVIILISGVDCWLVAGVANAYIYVAWLESLLFFLLLLWFLLWWTSDLRLVW